MNEKRICFLKQIDIFWESSCHKKHVKKAELAECSFMTFHQHFRCCFSILFSYFHAICHFSSLFLSRSTSLSPISYTHLISHRPVVIINKSTPLHFPQLMFVFLQLRESECVVWILDYSTHSIHPIPHSTTYTTFASAIHLLPSHFLLLSSQ